MKYIGILNQDPNARRLAEDVRRGVYGDDSAFFLCDLEAWFKHRASQLLHNVEIYNPNDQEADGITVYMRCLEAVGVDTSKEAEHVRQVMRDAVEKSKDEDWH